MLNIQGAAILDSTGQRRFLKTVLTLFIATALILLFIKYLLPCLLPFVLAFFTAWLIEPVVRYFSKYLGGRRWICSAVCILFLILSIIGFCALFISRLIYEATDLISSLPQLFSGLPNIMSRIEGTIDSFISRSPDGIREYISTAIDGIYKKVSDLPAELSSKALGVFSAFLGKTPKMMLFFATYSIGSFFISRSYPAIRTFIKKQIPSRFQAVCRNIKNDLLSGFGKWIKAQITLLCITFIELTIAFIILGFEHAGIIAVLTALIDALPVFGTGTVLIPWAAVLFIGNSVSKAFGLIITYLAVTVIRNCLEPKLVAGQFGIDPAAALLTMYSGFKLSGIAGMVLFPFGLMLIKQMNDKGYIKLWK